jgi:glycogen debranching enzyme
MSIFLDTHNEWLEADGLGGFASGTTSGERTRRYHALLMTAVTPPTGRMVLVNGLEAWVETPTGRFAISTQRYQPDAVYPDGASRLVDFQVEPWPQWTFCLPDGTTVIQELFVPHNISACLMRWKFSGTAHATLTLRPLISGRDYHGLHHENPAFRFEPEGREGWLVWRAYDGVPEVWTHTNGVYQHEPEWYRNFRYTLEVERGLDSSEDLASPGTLHFDLSQPAVLIFAAQGHAAAIDATVNSSALGKTPAAGNGNPATVAKSVAATTNIATAATATLPPLTKNSAIAVWTALSKSEQRRRTQFPTPLHRSADAYLVRRGAGQTIIAGYPWFTDWGRDTFISLRGLCVAIDRLDVALEILLAWSATVSEGMLPNRFLDAGDHPEFNSVDASLWFVIAVHDLLAAATRRGKPISAQHRRTLQEAILAIVEGYSRGTRFGIHQDTDGLLVAGVPGVQLTWMDAKAGDWVVTPRIGKPVEIQALWLNALWIAGQIDKRWTTVFETGHAEFQRRFWNSDANCLFDVVDVDHEAGKVDALVRPNQIFAVGGLPLSLLQADRATSVVATVETHLITPLGLRSLAPGSPGYISQYIGTILERDGAYHQGIVWEWLMGPFVEAWVRVRGNDAAAKREARHRFLPPLEDHLHSYGLNHISEIADAESPFTPRGCPFQAWSLGEYLRLQYDVLRE